MKVIGFANKFYTLWEVTNESRPLGNGRSYLITHYWYIKNISFDRDKAFNEYPEASFDESLRGHTRSWSSKKEVWDNVDTFRFGQFYGQKIGNHDIDYLAWYWENVSGDHRQYVENILTMNGYVVENDSHGSRLLSPEDVENIKREREELNNMIAKVSESDTLYVDIDHNCDESGYYRDGNVLYHFQEVKENWYSGFYYYLPSINGKAKRIKNKTIKIDKFTYEFDKDHNDLKIEILKFDVMKNPK